MAADPGGNGGGPAGGSWWTGVLFDLDGTLADSVPLILACYRHTMSVHRGEPLPDELWLRTIGRPLRDAMGDFARDDAEREAMVATYAAYQGGVHDDMVCALEGAAGVVARVRERGARTAIVTSKSAAMARRTIASCGMTELFETVVTPEDVTRGKPDPEPVRVALARMGLGDTPGRVLFVGDSPFDVAAGRDAGVRTAAVPSGPFPRETLEAERPDHLLERLEEVLELRP